MCQRQVAQQVFVPKPSSSCIKLQSFSLAYSAFYQTQMERVPDYVSFCLSVCSPSDEVVD